MTETFEKLLGENNPLCKAIEDRGFENPSEIQEKSIPSILEGKDIIAGASTGSGKTLAFSAGLIKNVEKGFGIQGLVLTPTRELAEQITKELSDFSKYKDLNILSVYGGVSIYNQVKMLPNTEIVVATPGRVLDHLERNSIDLSKVNTLVLDEADKMFDMGFIEDVEKIISNCPNKRQTLLFSATISQDVSRLSNKYMKNPLEISAKPHVDPKKLEQVYYDIDDNLKFSLLKHLLENEKSKLVMIFCNTRRNVDFLANNFKFMDLDAVPIHGGYSQDKRNRFLDQFNSGKTHILIATDVAARGLDIKGISHIYNYDIPLSKNEYTHRIGRTARAGKEGKVINLLSSRGYENFQPIIESNEFTIKQEKPPYIERVRIRWMPERKFERNRRRGSMRHERESGNWNRRRSDNKDRDQNRSNQRDNKRDNYRERGDNKRSNFNNNPKRTPHNRNDKGFSRNNGRYKRDENRRDRDDRRGDFKRKSNNSNSRRADRRDHRDNRSSSNNRRRSSNNRRR
ncbi:ATP-dependent RNA helicase [Candidatus Pacearchaeota archaeon]|nr:ATP-dependent RNA helicase [Candidatus Pacearchaeota archaeon]